MFEEALLSAPLPGVGPVAVEPDGVVDAEVRALLDGLAAEYAAMPAAGVLPFGADEVAVGAQLAALLAGFDPSVADGYDLVEASAGWERLAAWVEANKARVAAALASRAEMRPDTSGYRSVNPVTNTAVAIAGRCHLTTRQAEYQVGHSLQLVEDFPDTHALLSAGLIDLRRARVITDELGGQDPAVRERVEAAVLPRAPQLDSVALRKLIRQLLQELAPVETAERHRRARDGRYVAVTPASDGMAFLEALIPAEDATAWDTVLNVAAADAKRADAAAGVPARTRDQRRADALAELGWAALGACADGATGYASTAGTGHASAAPGDAATPEPAGRAARTVADRTSTPEPAVGARSAVVGGSGAARTGSPEPHVGARSAVSGSGRASAAPADAAPEPAVRAARPGADRTAWPEPAVGARSAPAAVGGGADRTVTAGPAGYARPAEDAASGGPPGDHVSLPSAVGSRPRRRPVSVHVTIPFATLAGLTDQPGELDGYGPIPAHVARALAAEGVWTWLAHDPGTGQLLDLGRTRYRPTKALAEFIVARDRTCRTPGCHRSAKAADIDHLVPFADGGTTDPANCHALCETHHLLKHHGGWSVQRDRDGTTRWRSPTGHRYEKPPERLGLPPVRLDPSTARQPRPPG
ncbi:HNH endonuclease signature motif containing protein [Jiangella alkaliphila]|uniref:HNH endonuclease signature motif containing protein n=1 Tax=Jiangella alkaliphila TaxID=419479 RepID=UPI001364E1C9|nr:HNH endonuclease signature motif containing protein [Jiangella alkaliphila]